MKKIFVLTVLFLLPIVAYLFFASGVNNFAKLPVLTGEVRDISHLPTSTDTAVSFQKKISVVGFFGGDLQAIKGHTFNLDQKILGKFYEFHDFQFVIIVPDTVRSQTREFIQEFSGVTNPEYWTFVYGQEQDIKEIFASFNSNFTLDDNLQTPYVFIVDKEMKVRGRDEDEDGNPLYGYDSRRVAELNSKMKDDVKILLAEYRLATKKNNPPVEN